MKRCFLHDLRPIVSKSKRNCTKSAEIRVENTEKLTFGAENIYI